MNQLDPTQGDRARWRLTVPAWPVVLVLGLLLFAAIRQAVLTTHNARLLPAMVLFGTLVVPVTFLTFVWSRPMWRAVPAAVVTAVATIGGCLAVVVAAVVENAALRGATIGAPGQLPLPAVAVIEEGTKVLVVIVVLVFVVAPTPANGLLVGMATGSGFAVLETLGFAFGTYVQDGGGVRALDADLVTRSLFTPATHVAWAGLAGWAVGFTAYRRWRGGSVLVLIGTVLGVVALHTLWDERPFGATYPVLTVLDLGLLAGAVRLSMRAHST